MFNMELLLSAGVRISMSRKGNPYDNAWAESFMKTLKCEEVYLWDYETFADVKRRVPYFIEEVPKERVKGTNIKRKIFSKGEEKDSKLLCVLNFLDFNHVEIKLIEPQDRSIRESSENFITIFLRGALLKIKDDNPDLELNYDYFKNSKLIERINLTNLKSIQEFDLITSKMRELLAKEVGS